MASGKKDGVTDEEFRKYLSHQENKEHNYN